MELFKLEQLTFQYPMNDTPSLKKIDLTIREGEFVLLCGSSGCGKTTLLKQMKREITPAGSLGGSITYCGVPLRQIDKEVSAREIGFVFQNPDNQIVMADVYSELAFGMENLRFSSAEMKRKIAELCSFFGMEGFLDKEITQLSGGQKQVLNLASVLLLQPRVLLLDEPTSQLDPVAAKEFLLFLKRLNEEFGMTILLSEHRFDDVYPLCSRVLFLENGAVELDAEPKQAVKQLSAEKSDFVPAQAFLSQRLRKQVDSGAEICLTVRENQRLIEQNLDRLPGWEPSVRSAEKTGQPLLEVKRLFLKYTLEEAYVLKDLSLTLEQGKCTCLLGANGSGKSTLLKAIAGILKPQAGKIKWMGEQRSVTYLPQNPLLFFSFERAEEELYSVCAEKEKIERLVSYLELTHCMPKHPHDLSGGEQQRLMIACGLLRETALLLMDEPAKGLDQRMKARLGDLLQEYQQNGGTVLLVTHDVDFAAGYADNCCLLFNGSTVSEKGTADFFAGNYFYTTNINRMVRRRYPAMLTRKEVDSLWQKK